MKKLVMSVCVLSAFLSIGNADCSQLRDVKQIRNELNKRWEDFGDAVRAIAGAKDNWKAVAAEREPEVMGYVKAQWELNPVWGQPEDAGPNVAKAITRSAGMRFGQTNMWVGEQVVWERARSLDRDTQMLLAWIRHVARELGEAGEMNEELAMWVSEVLGVHDELPPKGKYHRELIQIVCEFLAVGQRISRVHVLWK